MALDLQFNQYSQGDNTAQENMPFEQVYDPIHLAMTCQMILFDRFAEQKLIPANSGVDKAFAFRYRSMRPATTPLTEGVPPASEKIFREKVEWTVAQYGSFVEYTDLFDILDVDKVTNEFMRVLSQQAAETKDVITRDIISSGNRVIYAGLGANRASLDGTKYLGTQELELAVLNLKNARAKKYKKVLSGSPNHNTEPIREAYLGITHPNCVVDLEKLEGFVPVEKYAYSKDIMEYEIGSWRGIRFLEDTNSLVVDEAGNNVYITLVFGEGAYATTGIRGEAGTKTIHKPLGSAGTADPLNQKGTIGWKMIAGAKILDELFLIRLESNASLDVPNLIRYDDPSEADAVTDATPVSLG